VVEQRGGDTAVGGSVVGAIVGVHVPSLRGASSTFLPGVCPSASWAKFGYPNFALRMP
jgi:hypothetical protein